MLGCAVPLIFLNPRRDPSLDGQVCYLKFRLEADGFQPAKVSGCGNWQDNRSLPPR